MNLKQKNNKNPSERKFAYLIEPTDPVGNDEELYAAVHKNGRAVLREFEGVTFILGDIKEVPPIEFEETWQGD